MNFVSKLSASCRRAIELHTPLLNYGGRFFSQTGEDMILAHLFENQQNGFYVDIGAHHPIQYSNTYYFYRKGWMGINIDAMPGCMMAFNHCRPLDTNIEMAINTFCGEIEMSLYDEPALNTLSEKTVE